MNTTESDDLTTAPAKTLDCDVLVIGSGAGGLSAAVTAAYHGLKVIVVEKAHGLRRRHVLVRRLGLDPGKSVGQSCRRQRGPGSLPHLPAPPPRRGLPEPTRSKRSLRPCRTWWASSRTKPACSSSPASQYQGHLRPAHRAPEPATARWAPSPSTPAASNPKYAPRCATSSTRPRSWAWASWPDPTSPNSSHASQGSLQGLFHAACRVTPHLWIC